VTMLEDMMLNIWVKNLTLLMIILQIENVYVLCMDYDYSLVKREC